MGWQDELRDQVAARSDDDMLDAWPLRWSEHTVRTTLAVATVLMDHADETNGRELVGIRPGAMRLLGVRKDSRGYCLRIGVREHLAWNRYPAIDENPMAGTSMLHFPEMRDAAGNLRYPPFDFTAVVEGWRELPGLL